MVKKPVCKRCAFTGYRPQKMPWGEDENNPLCVEFKARLKRALESLIGNGYATFIRTHLVTCLCFSDFWSQSAIGAYTITAFGRLFFVMERIQL